MKSQTKKPGSTFSSTDLAELTIHRRAMEQYVGIGAVKSGKYLITTADYKARSPWLQSSAVAALSVSFDGRQRD